MAHVHPHIKIEGRITGLMPSWQSVNIRLMISTASSNLYTERGDDACPSYRVILGNFIETSGHLVGLLNISQKTHMAD